MTQKPVVAFICVHNSCRSQMAEAVGKLFASDTFESFSAGTETVPQINPDAVDIVKKKYGYTMSNTQYSKPISALPPVDIVITMGCNVACPSLPARHREDWGLSDPSGKSLEEFEKTLNTIEQKIKDLKKRILNKELP